MKIKAILQKLRLSIGRLILDRHNSNNKLTLPQKILFMRQDGKIGDYIVSSFVFREIKKAYPDIEIGIVCTHKDAYLYQQNQYIDRIYYVKNRSIIDYIKCGLHLKKENYDVVIDPTILLRNRDLLLLRLINANHYIGYRKKEYKLFDINIEKQAHFSEIYQSALTQLGFQITDHSYDVPFSSDAKNEITDYLNENQINHYIAINFFGASRSRKIEPHNIHRYIQHLQKIASNKALVLLSFPAVFEQLHTIAKKYQNVYVHQTSNIFHTIELIKHADWLISPDTATVHIASGLNKKIIALYGDGQENFTHWKPKSSGKTHILFYKKNINEIQPEQLNAEWLNE